MMNLEILTPTGFQKFDTVKKYWHDSSLKIIFDDESEIGCAFEHRFIVNGNIIFAKNLNVGDNIGKKIINIKTVNKGNWFYDPINVNNGSIYCHDVDFVSHNSFLGTGQTLISAEALLKLRAQSPKRILENGKLFIYNEPIPDHDYVMLVDVSGGKGADYSTFNVIDISTRPFKQVAVYRNNYISPILYPTIIYKYAKIYNEAYVVVESNDVGGIVCAGLWKDLEYENLHIESSINTKDLGVRMTVKTKKLGCTGIKDLIEAERIDICDANTIDELSTFQVKGNSFEASDGNHDDLVMNLVLLGYFIHTSKFSEISDIDIKNMMFEQRAREIEDDVPPFGFIENGIQDIIPDEDDEKTTVWPLQPIDWSIGNW